LLVLVAVGGAAGAVYYFWLRPQPRPAEDMAAALAANTRGVGLMEQFEYNKAATEFEHATKLAPDWTPAKINLGIALFNQQPDKVKDLADPVVRAQQIFKDVLAKDPDNRHAHYCLGIIAQYVGKFPEAYEHYEAVNKLDPEDAHTWLRLGTCHPKGPLSAESRVCFEKAVKLDPYLNEARYRLFQALQESNPEGSKGQLDEFERLRAIEWETMSRIERYSEQGKYADVIGRDLSLAGKPEIGPIPMFEPAPGFKVTLAAGTRWATSADLSPIQKAARERFGGTIVLFDYNRDGRPDIFLVAAVVESGKVRDLLLRNDGNNAFTDVTSAAGLATPRPSLGAAAADYDNDGFPDLVVTGAGEQHLFRNKGDGAFEDVSAAAGLDKEKGVCLGCGWVDLDQDCDLDLILCRYADNADGAGLFANGASKVGGVLLFENIGEAKPSPPNAPQPPLTTKFKLHEPFSKVVGQCAAVSFVASDIDGDGDIDLVILADESAPIVLENHRLMRFRRTTPAWANESHRWNGGLAFVATHGERSDLLFVRVNGPPTFLKASGMKDYVAGNTNSPQLRHAVAVDLDMDGWPDVVGLGADGKPTFLHNQGDGRLENKANPLGDTEPALAIACADLDGDGAPDLLLWSEKGIILKRNTGNGNKSVLVEPTGKRDKGESDRTNADGIGCWIVAQSGPHWTAAERTTVSAGLGQSLLPTALGMGKAPQADVIRLRWPDGVIQAELLAASVPNHRIVEKNRKSTSCPVLMTWDGERFVFVTDFVGAGSMGESAADGSTRPPRPEESVKIEPHQLKPKNGQFVLKVTEPMDEVLYLDHFQLVAIDHPADSVVHPDERFATADPQPTQELLAFRDRHFPKKATDHRGNDVTARILERDRLAEDTFHTRSWLGFAENHSLTLDFGDLPKGGDQRWYLVLAGWTEYPYPESIYAAERAGVPCDFPVLERLAADGKTWDSLGDLGFPAGLPRVMTRPLPGFKTGEKCVLRIRTNLQIYWDQVYLAPAVDVGMKTHTLDVARADLAYRGFVQEIHPDGRPPIAYDDSKTEQVPVTKWKGNLTRLGDVTELLRAADDRFVICGPGDEVTLQFDETKLPALPPGWTRSFVLKTRGYSKDSAPTTQTGGQVGPLPFRAMKNYPNFGYIQPPATDAAKCHTRPAGGR
jgi:hypothetical protein